MFWLHNCPQIHTQVPCELLQNLLPTFNGYYNDIPRAKGLPRSPVAPLGALSRQETDLRTAQPPGCPFLLSDFQEVSFQIFEHFLSPYLSYVFGST